MELKRFNSRHWSVVIKIIIQSLRQLPRANRMLADSPDSSVFITPGDIQFHNEFPQTIFSTRQAML